MKKSIKHILLSFCALALCSCSGFLDKQNPVRLPTVGGDKAALEAACRGAIGSYVGTYGISGNAMEFFPYCSGLTHWGNYSSKLDKQEYSSTLQLTQYSTTNYNGQFYKTLYITISDANDILDCLKTSPVTDEKFLRQIEGEARLYRALTYFWIVRIWGDTPLKLDPDTYVTACNDSRDPYYKVYEEIVKDLEFAAENMRTPEEVAEVSPTYPRPNKYAAIAYLASVYATIGSLLASPDDNFWNPDKEGRKPDFSGIGIDCSNYETAAAQAYTKALEYAEKIIPESESFDPGSKYRLLEKFGDFFNFDPEFSRNGYTAWINPEQIIAVPFTIATDIAGQMVKYSAPDFPEGSTATISNSSKGRFRPDRWVFQKWCETYPGKMDGNNSMYISTSDPRMDATFYYGSMKYCNGSGTLTMYPSINTTGSESSYPYFRKNMSKRYNVNAIDSDLIIMRFAQVYFDAAEAAAYLGNVDKARKYIEVIHARARHSVPDGQPDSKMPSWETTEFEPDNHNQQMRDAIFWEWVFEFIGEGQEFQQTHRHGANWLVRNITKPKNAFLARTTEKSFVGSFYPAKEQWYSENGPYSEDPDELRKALLAAYPANELLYNSGMTADSQNDYWYNR